jgi:biotin carboxyl carrier protein
MDKNKEFYKITIDDTPYESLLTKKFVARKKYVPVNPKNVIAVIPGIIQDVFVKKGQTVKRNDFMLILEAMKMNNTISSPIQGVIKEVYAKKGMMVTKGELLIEFE